MQDEPPQTTAGFRTLTLRQLLTAVTIYCVVLSVALRLEFAALLLWCVAAPVGAVGFGVCWTAELLESRRGHASTILSFFIGMLGVLLITLAGSAFMVGCLWVLVGLPGAHHD